MTSNHRMDQFTRHPFSVPETVSVFYVGDIPIDLLNPMVKKTSTDPKIQQLVEDIRKHGIHAPLILDFNNGKMDVLLGNKRLFAAKTLGYTMVKGIINVCSPNSINFNSDWQLLLQGARRLWNSDNVIKVFGCPIDVQHLCLDKRGRLICVASDHQEWATSKEGTIPETWCQLS